MKKIAFVINEFNSLYDFRKEFVQELIKHKEEVHIIGPKSGKYDYFDKLGCHIHFVNLERKGKSIFNDLKYRKQLKVAIKEIKPDFLFSYSMKPNLHSGNICRKHKIPHTATVTGLGMAFKINKIVSFVLIRLLRKSLKKTKVVFCQNSSDAEFLKKNKIAINQIEVINGSGVNLEEHTFSEYPKSDNVVFLYAGRIVKNKGISELLEAFDLLSKNHTNVYLNIAGEIDNDEYKSILDNYCFKNNRIKYLRYSNNLDELIKQSSAIVVPSYTEGMSNVLQESLACGRPVLASNIPGCKEICVDGETGLIFEPKNVQSLSKALERFALLKLDQKMSMGQTGRKWVTKHFDRNKIIDKYQSLLNK